MLITFAKFQGTGNDFIIIDDRNDYFPKDKKLIEKLCNRKLGIGADGLILLKDSLVADFQMQYWNCDGSGPLMCGNGLRCLAAYIRKEFHLDKFFIETLQGVHEIRGSEGNIAVSMGVPKALKWGASLIFGDKDKTGYIIDTGVPHAVFFVEKIHQENFVENAKKVRNAVLLPNGVNVNIASIKEENVLCLRTYERGVEGETLSCGTGAVAAAFAAMEIFSWKGPVKIIPSSMECLEVIREDSKEIFLKGPAKSVFCGVVEIKEESYVDRHSQRSEGPRISCGRYA